MDKKVIRPELSWLENPEVFRVNRLDAHSDHHSYETEEDMAAKKETLRQCLNGTWQFAWSSSPSARPAEFCREDADRSGFADIQVPGHMELQGYDQIQYINTMYPWDGHTFLEPPQIDWEYNPVGSYVKEFDLEEGLRGRRVCISFQGVEEAMYVWLNGVFIGYAEDTFTPSEFDLTDVVREKGNLLCVEVYKRSSAAWIEDQDFFRFSGIFRDVYLYAKPEVHAEDLWVHADLASDWEIGRLALEVKTSGRENVCVKWELRDADGVCAADGVFAEHQKCSGFFGCDTVEKTSEAGASVMCREQKDGMEKTAVNTTAIRMWKTGVIEIPHVHKWHVGAPYLYDLTVRLYREADGALLEVIPYRIGFRHFEIRNGVMELNGERLVINGVNRHEWSAEKGRAIGAEEMKQDIEIFKRNNINAVRTCHYPDQSLWYQLCDEAGIIMIDETNLESHGSWSRLNQCEPSHNVPGSRPEWEACVVDRAASMLERDKNHPAILWWSCGNESYAGTCILAMSRYFHEKDPSRVVHYEGVFWNREFDEISDVESRMYAPPEAIREYLENDPKKPFLLCEYMHDMGNSIGGMESYIRLLEEYPMYQGGFIWDYADQALYRTAPNGTHALGYGGDFGERATDYAFSGNGIVFADRTEKPAMQEVRFWYQTPRERGAFLKEQEKKREIAETRVAEEMENWPGKRKCADAESSDGSCAECASAGGSDISGAVCDAELSETAVDKNGDFLKIAHGDSNYGVSGNNFEILFSFVEGGPVSLKYDGREYLYRAPKPAFWRASTENDKGSGFQVRSSVWMSADTFSRSRACRVTEYTEDGTELNFDVMDTKSRAAAAENIVKTTLVFTYETATVPAATVDVAYTVDAGGRMHVALKYHGAKGLPELPEFGLRMVMPEAVAEYRWEGLSGETYPDRFKGGRFGVHTDVPSIPAYLVPQECGNHAGTVQAELEGLRIVMDHEAFHFSALPNTPCELESAMHREELPNTGRTVVSVLGRMRGVGGIDSWGSDVEEPYRISAEEDIAFAFYILPGSIK